MHLLSGLKRVAVSLPCALALWLFSLALAARAQNVELPPVALPSSEPSAPSLWFTPAQLAEVQARRTSPSSGPHYAQVRGFVDGSLAGLAANASALGDDTLSQLAKGAALLQSLGDTPPPGGAFTSYRDAAVVALEHIGPREAVTVLNVLGPPSDAIDILHDSPRLQSMAEAYDLLRGSQVMASDDSAMRAIIDQWAQAIYGDLDLNGAFGIGGHRDNWGLKGGTALITTALSLSLNSNAPGWMTFGNALVKQSFEITGSSAGWYRESAHYLNYTLDDLFSTAVQVRMRTGVDWFAALRPFAQAALDLRQPDGTEAPFEEGVPCVFPFDVFAPFYPDLGGQLAFAWNHSDRNTDSWPNQQLAEGTRFLAGDLPDEVAPGGRPSRFVQGDAHISALRSGFDAQATQATLFAAVDFSSATITNSRHNMQNPLDLVVAGAGEILLPTSGGGPQVTNSTHRSYYLLPSSKNIPLVNGTAPFVTDATRSAVDLRLAGRDATGLRGRYLELARATVSAGYAAPVRSISRTAALIGGQWVLIHDEINSGSSGAAIGLPFHGRGSIAAGAAPHFATWTFQAAALDLFSIASAPLTLTQSAGFYAPVYGTEEAIQGVELDAQAPSLRALTLLVPRKATQTAPAVDDRSAAGLLALRVTSAAAIDHLAAGAVTRLDGVSTDAAFSAVRESAGRLSAFGLVQATQLSFAGVSILRSDAPLTLSVSLPAPAAGTAAASGLVAEVSPDQAGTSSFSLSGLAGFDPGVPWQASFEDAVLDGQQFQQSPAGFSFNGLNGGGTLVVQPLGPRVLGPLADQTVSEGQPLAFTLPATAPAGMALAFSVSVDQPLPGTSAPTLDAATGAFAWTPGFDVASRSGPRDLVFTFFASASASGPGAFTVSQACKVRVVDVNRAPVLRPPGDLVARRGAPFMLQLSASDPDGDPLTYAFSSQPALPAAFDAQQGTLRWTPSADAPLGPVALHFTVSDGLAEASASSTLTIEEAEPAPVIAGARGGCASGGVSGALSLLALFGSLRGRRRRAARMKRRCAGHRFPCDGSGA